MNDLDLLQELAQDTPLPGPASLASARARLITAITSDPATGHPLAPERPSPGRHAWRFQSRKRLILGTVVTAAATAALVLAAVQVMPAGPAERRVDPAAARVLHRAALAALERPAGAPRPGQFVYTKIADGDGSVYQSWLSVDGTRSGLIRGAGGSPIHVPGCRAGHQLRVQAPTAEGGAPGGHPCTPQPAYFPGMPASPHALRSYLERTRDLDHSSAWYLNDFGKAVDELLSQAYLSSRQRAGLYDLMAQTPGFTLIPHAADGIGRPGVGIAWPAPGGRTVIIFNPDTYAELGVTTSGAGGASGAGALLKLAIVNKPGQLP